MFKNYFKTPENQVERDEPAPSGLDAEIDNKRRSRIYLLDSNAIFSNMFETNIPLDYRLLSITSDYYRLLSIAIDFCQSITIDIFFL